MKFWELISAFRSEPDNLKQVFAKDCWEQYRLNYEDIDAIVIRQDRSILDEEVPFQLAKEVCELSKLEFYLYYKENPHRLRALNREENDDCEVVSAYSVLVRFGGCYIEETLEYGSATVMPKENRE